MRIDGNTVHLALLEAAQPDDADEGLAAPADPRPAVLAPPLEAPVDGQTQQSIVGDITWTRVEGDITTVPSDIVFELDGVFYGNRLSYGVVDGTDPTPQWWTSSDGVTWAAWDAAPEDTDLTVVGGTIWAEASQFGSAEPPALGYWDGTGFVAIDLPGSDDPPGRGLTVRSTELAVVGAGDDGIVVQRREGFAVPWDELLGIEPPLQALEDGRSWEGTFRVRAWECTAVAVGGFECSSSRPAGPATWVIRPEIVEGPPTRIDLHDNGTGELITSIVPPDDGRPIDDVLFELGAENSVGSRTEHFVVDRDGTNVRPIDWAFGDAGFAELAGRRFVLAGGDGDELLLWVTDDGETWEQLALPAGIDQDGYSRLSSDGSTMILTTRGPYGADGLLVTNHPMWTTTDGTTWNALESPLPGYQTRGAESANFGWLDFHDDLDPEVPIPESPALAVSPDAETWQVVPLPIPTALIDRGLTWADTNQGDDEPYDFDLDWGWEAYAHGDTVFVALRSEGFDRARELWVGRVDTT